MTATQVVSPLDRLATLSAQRTARTDRLSEATCALLSQLAPHVEMGAPVTVDGYTLRRTRVRSNIGQADGWWLGTRSQDDCSDAVSCDLDRQVDGAGFTHGDFGCPWKGPSRAELLAFAARAARFVGAFIAREERALAALESAQASVEVAAHAVPS